MIEEERISLGAFDAWGAWDIRSGGNAHNLIHRFGVLSGRSSVSLQCHGRLSITLTRACEWSSSGVCKTIKAEKNSFNTWSLSRLDSPLPAISKRKEIAWHDKSTVSTVSSALVAVGRQCHPESLRTLANCSWHGSMLVLVNKQFYGKAKG